MTWLVKCRVIMKHLSRISVRIHRKYDVQGRYGGSFGKNATTLVIGTSGSIRAIIREISCARIGIFYQNKLKPHFNNSQRRIWSFYSTAQTFQVPFVSAFLLCILRKLQWNFRLNIKCKYLSIRSSKEKRKMRM